MKLETSTNAIAFSADDQNFTLSLWSSLPPAKADLIAAGATLISYERKFTTDNVKPNSYIKDVLFSLIPAYGEHATNKAHKAHNAKLVNAKWAKRLYVIRYNCGLKSQYNYVRIGTIAQDRKSNRLILFANNGMPYKEIPIRKHVTPKYIAQQIGGDIDAYRIECIQCDRIAKAKHKGYSEDRRRVYGAPAPVTGYNLNHCIYKTNQRSDDDYDMLPDDCSDVLPKQ